MIRSRLRQLHLILPEFSTGLCPSIYVKLFVFFFFKISSEYLEFYDNLYNALVHIKVKICQNQELG